jgi:head-tail adaptor
MITGEQSALILVQKKSGATDPDYNSQINMWLEYKKVWAKIEQLRSSERTLGMGQVDSGRCRICINYLDGRDITTDMRVVYEDTSTYKTKTDGTLSPNSALRFFPLKGRLGGTNERDEIVFEALETSEDSSN